MYKALYRKYRPDRFSKIFGQQHIVQTLINALEQEKTAHAYLFHGPRGTGKTSIAKIFAQALNCEDKTAADKPCHACPSCLLIDNGESSDIIELDAASNNGVDEIRQIRENAKYAPTHLQKKIYIIDEVHMLSTAAFNALLKTLEEPPRHVVFILATTEIHKIPLTIISRCQRFDFKKITEAEMQECLLPILEQEGITIATDALAYLTAYANGGMRDALSVLDQAIAYAGGSAIVLSDVLDVIGSVSEDTYMQIVQDILTKDTTRILQVIQHVIDSGKNMQLFVEEFIQYVLKEIKANLSGDGMFPTEQLFTLLELSNQLATKMRTAYLPHIALQAFFLELTHEATDIQKEVVLAPRVDVSTKTLDSVPGVVEQVAVIELTPVAEELPTITPVVADAVTSSIETRPPVVTPVDSVEVPLVAAADEVLDLFSYDPLDVQDDEEAEEIELVFDFHEHSEIDQTRQKSVSAKPMLDIALDTVESMLPVEPVAKAPQDVFDTKLHQEKTAVLLQRIMGEVMLYPDYNQLEKVKRRWQTIRFDPINPIVGMLLDMTPKLASQQEIVLSTFNRSLTNQLQIEPNLSRAEQFVSEIMGEACTLVFTYEANWLAAREVFLQKWKQGMVTPDEVARLHAEHQDLAASVLALGYEQAPTYVEKATEENESSIVREAKALFGEDIVEVID